MFFSGGTGRLVWIEGKMNAAMYRDILDDALERSGPQTGVKIGVKTTTLSTQPRQKRSGFGTTV